MKKIAFVLVLLISSLPIFAQKSLSSLTEENLSWRLLEKADSAYDERNFSRSASLVQKAKINRKEESKIYVDILERALSPLAVQKVGNNIDDVLAILEDRDSQEAITVIKEATYTKGYEYFSNSVQEILNYYKEYDIYPEADFLLAKIYRLEGEFTLAQTSYLTAWENSDKLDIPMVKYDILYELASLYKTQKNFDDYEKTLLLIVADDSNFYVNGKISPFLESVIQNIKKGTNLDKLFLLYRSDSYNQIYAYFQLAQIYEASGNYEKMLEVSTIGMLGAVTRIEQILQERELEYSYKNFSHFYSLLNNYDDVIEWGIENEIWKGFYDFGYALTQNKIKKLAKEVFNENAQYSPEEYWKKQSQEALKKL